MARDKNWVSSHCLDSVTSTNTPVKDNSVYSESQIVRFKQGVQSVIADIDAKLLEIDGQIANVTSSVEQSPWIPEIYQKECITGLLSNKEALGPMRSKVQAIVDGYDKLLISKDPSKLTDPRA
jgi:hypothetical protein